MRLSYSKCSVPLTIIVYDMLCNLSTHINDKYCLPHIIYNNYRSPACRVHNVKFIHWCVETMMYLTSWDDLKRYAQLLN